jgi:hypothetical protein
MGSMYWKPPKGEPTRASLSDALGFAVPDAFVSLVETLYEQSGRDPTKWPEWIASITGIELVSVDFRYTQTPPELFTFATLGVDGVHYGYVIHAPEQPAQDYPVGELSPMDGDGVFLVGSNTLGALENLMSGQLEYEVEESERRLIDHISQALSLHPTAEKAHSRYGPDGNGLPIQPAVPVGWSFMPSTDGIGVLAPNEAFRPGRSARLEAFGSPHIYLQQAEQALGEGFPATALYYLREGYWQNWTDSQIATVFDGNLTRVYEALGRPALAEVVECRGNKQRLR